MTMQRLKNRMIARIITRFPSLSRRFIDSFTPWEAEDIPWAPVTKPLNMSKVAIVTTAGVHHRDQTPFDMNDRNGDPSYRIIDASRPLSDLTITHDYYDHTDADKDINIVFPIERIREFVREGFIGKVSDRHIGFMGHIDAHHVHTLMKNTAPAAAHDLWDDDVDAVLLTPG